MASRYTVFPNWPKMNICFIFGGVPNHSVYGRCPVRECHVQLYSKVASSMASSQKLRGMTLWCNAALAGVTSTALILSAIPFSCGVYGMVVLCWIPKLVYTSSAAFNRYYLAVSIVRICAAAPWILRTFSIIFSFVGRYFPDSGGSIR